MRVLYDSHTFSEQTFGGISRYFMELMNHLPREVSYHLPLYASENIYLPLLKKKHRYFPLRHFPEHRKLYYFLNGFADRKALDRGNYDIFHPTGFDPYFIERVKSPVVVTVHDMIYHYGLNPGKHTAEIIDNMTRTTLRADRVIAISKATKDGVMKFYNIPEDKIDVIHHGFTPSSGSTDPLPYCPERYILFVGHRGGYKNFDTLLKAFSLISGSEPSLNLLCTGRPFSNQELQRISSIGLKDRCIHHFIPDNDMYSLYANAECFVFPSRMEGFGMPVLESFAARCPVVLSDASCFPEVAGKGGIFFNPEDPDELAEKIRLTIGDSIFRTKKIEAGLKELQRFSWEKTAIATAATYKKAIES